MCISVGVAISYPDEECSYKVYRATKIMDLVYSHTYLSDTGPTYALSTVTYSMWYGADLSTHGTFCCLLLGSSTSHRVGWNYSW